MKKIFLASLIGLAFVSCKKDYTCECTTTQTSNGQTSTSVSTVEILEVSKKTVNNSVDCVSYETKDTYDGETMTTKVDCDIKKK